MSTSSLLADLEAVIQARLNNQATDSFNVRNKGWNGAPLQELFKIRRDLKEEIAAEENAGGGLSLIDPIGN